MARKPNPRREQIAALEAITKADRAARRKAERPLRAARRPLAERVRLLQRNLTRALARRERMCDGCMYIRTDREAEWIHGQQWRDTIAAIEKHTVDLKGAEADLALFDHQHPELT